MKIILLISLFLLTPFSLYSQTYNSEHDVSVVIRDSKSTDQDFQMLPPVLLRKSSIWNSDNEEFVMRNNSKYVSFLSSLAVPGVGQALNKNWWRTGLYAAIEAASIYFLVDYRNSAGRGETKYEKFADNNWSVVQYSRWLVNYHDINGLENPYIDELRSMIKGNEATYKVQKDWEVVDLEVLRNVERNTPYITPDQMVSHSFSHTLPNYGSQQYYELIAKYYQYQGGWKDYNSFHDSIGHTGMAYNDRYLIDRNGEFASPFFYRGVLLADQFNTDYRRSGYFVSLLIANHIISAFDAFFTLKLKQNKLQASSSMIPGRQFTLTYRF